MTRKLQLCFVVYYLLVIVVLGFRQLFPYEWSINAFALLVFLAAVGIPLGMWTMWNRISRQSPASK